MKPAEERPSICAKCINDSRNMTGLPFDPEQCAECHRVTKDGKKNTDTSTRRPRYHEGG